MKLDSSRCAFTNVDQAPGLMPERGAAAGARLHSARLHSPSAKTSQGGSRSPRRTSALVIGLQNVPQQSVSG
eukprot:1159178-Pelagomonas_calceolata.AAC.3